MPLAAWESTYICPTYIYHAGKALELNATQHAVDLNRQTKWVYECSACHRSMQPFVGVTDHQLNPSKATSYQASQKRRPKSTVLTHHQVKPQHLSFPGFSDANDGDLRHSHHPSGLLFKLGHPNLHHYQVL